MSIAGKSAAIIGGGPGGLMAAEVLIQGGLRVDLYEAKPSLGRKFLVAGKGGLNLTHSEPFEQFLTRYGETVSANEPLLKDFGPEQVRSWASGFGIDTFTGTSGRVFPVGMKTAPLLHAWLERLRTAGVSFHTRHRGSAGTGMVPCASQPPPGKSPRKRVRSSWRWAAPAGRRPVPPAPGCPCSRNAASRSTRSNPPTAVLT